jgi:hypothetical protein
MKTKQIIHLAILFSIYLTSCGTQVVATPVSTHMLTPTNTPLPTITATPLSATKLEKQADGTWAYYDNEAGFQFQLGKNWYLEDVSSLNVTDIIERTSKITTELGLKNTPLYFIEPQGMRVLGVYTDETIPDYMSAAFNSSYIIDEDFAKMPLEDIQKRIIEILANTHGLDISAFDSKLSKNEHGTEYGVVFFNLALNYYQMRVFFKLENGLGMATFGFSDKNIDTFGPDWALLTGSLKYIQP